MVQWKRIQLGTIRLRVRSLASLGGLRICRCRELWCRSQTQLGSCSSHWTPSLGTSLCHECGPTKEKKKKKKKPTERKPYLEVHQLKKKEFLFSFLLVLWQTRMAGFPVLPLFGSKRWHGISSFQHRKGRK